jgi:hypothetical protein
MHYCEPLFGNTALHIAAYKNKVGVIQRLLLAKCNPHILNHDGLSALDLARLREHREACAAFAQVLVTAKGWLFIKKNSGSRSFMINRWKKHWCMVYESCSDYSHVELAIYQSPDDVKPHKVLFLNATENAMKIAKETDNGKRHIRKHNFGFSATTTYMYFGQNTFSRSRTVRQNRYIPVYNASAIRFATETTEGRDQWIELLGPLAFSNVR